MGRLIAIALVPLLLAAAVAVAAQRHLRDDDRPVSASSPEAQQALAVAREVVDGTLVDVRRDEDNGKWEVTLRRDGRDYEVELDPVDFTLLRVDYD